MKLKLIFLSALLVGSLNTFSIGISIEGDWATDLFGITQVIRIRLKGDNLYKCDYLTTYRLYKRKEVTILNGEIEIGGSGTYKHDTIRDVLIDVSSKKKYEYKRISLEEWEKIMRGQKQVYFQDGLTYLSSNQVAQLKDSKLQISASSSQKESLSLKKIGENPNEVEANISAINIDTSNTPKLIYISNTDKNPIYLSNKPPKDINLMTTKNAYLICSKIYTLYSNSVCTNTDNKFISYRNKYLYKYIDYHNRIFDRANYDKMINDEFSYDSYAMNSTEKLDSAIAQTDLSQKYFGIYNAQFGEYSFPDSTFPITNMTYWGDVGELGNGLFHKCDQEINKSGSSFCLKAVISWIDNIEQFSGKINISPTEAKKLIEKRKNADGTVNREIYLKRIFSFTDVIRDLRTTIHDGYLYEKKLTVHLYSIEVYEDRALTKKLTTLTPKSINYELTESELNKFKEFDIKNEYSQYSGLYRTNQNEYNPLVLATRKGDAVFIHIRFSTFYNFDSTNSVYKQSKENKNKFINLDNSNKIAIFNSGHLFLFDGKKTTTYLRLSAKKYD